MKNRKIERKNYFLLALIAIVTIMIVIYTDSLYKNYRSNNISLVVGTISEIKEKDFENYLTDNADTIIYMARGKDISLRNFEKDFIKLIKDKQITKEIVYLNLDNISNDFYSNLKVNYFSDSMKQKNIVFNGYANIIVVKDRKVIDVLYDKKSTINKIDVVSLLKEHDVTE